MKKSVSKIVLGIIASTGIMGILFYFFMFWNPLNIHEPNSLQWIPVLITLTSMYVSGRINRTTPLKWLPLLFLPFVVFRLFHFAWFPFILVLILTGVLVLIATRKYPLFPYSPFSWVAVTGLFIYFLFTQPLIFEREGFRQKVNGDLVHATVVWDFTGKEKKQLPEYTLQTVNGEAFNLSSIEGQTYLVSFWATWCAPCIQTKPALEQLKLDYADTPEMGFIDVSFDEDYARWKGYLEENQPSGQQLISENPAKTSRVLGFAGIPTYLLVLPDGTYKEYESFEVVEKAVRKTER